MLRIKKEIDLKELKKYGFEYEPILKQYYKIYISFWLNNIHMVRIDEDTKKILLNNPTPFPLVKTSKNRILKKLYKLKLVEKVGYEYERI